METVTNLFNKLPKWVFILAMCIVTLFAVMKSYKMFSNQFVDLSTRGFQPLEKAYDENFSMLKVDSFNLNISKAERTILIKKVSIIQHKKDHHLFITRNLYKNNYAFLSLFPFLSAITGIFVFFIIQSGWQKSNAYLKFGLIIFGTLTTLSTIFPDIYQQEQSISKNLKNYVEYDYLQNEIFSYSLTAPLINQDSITFPHFLDQINSKENELNKIYFGLSEEEFNNPFLEQFSTGN